MESTLAANSNRQNLKSDISRIYKNYSYRSPQFEEEVNQLRKQIVLKLNEALDSMLIAVQNRNYLGFLSRNPGKKIDFLFEEGEHETNHEKDILEAMKKHPIIKDPLDAFITNCLF